MERFSRIMMQLMHEGSLNKKQLETFMIRRVTLSSTMLGQKGELLLEKPFRKLIRYDSTVYFIGCMPPPPEKWEKTRPGIPPQPDAMHPDSGNCIVLQDLQPGYRFPFWLVLGNTNLTLLLFFAYFIKKLLPLRKLKLAIERLGDATNTQVRLPVSGHDEIADIAEAYNRALGKIETMREARSLFLRNILHELKTPIMKGKLMADFIADPQRRTRMELLFERMEFLLREFSNIEKFTSREWPLQKENYRFVDILDHACDLALCERDKLMLSQSHRHLCINVDYEFFSIALKNLIDNALRYSEHIPFVRTTRNTVEICSRGKPLDVKYQNFEQAFNRPYESTSGSLGLGLYITNAIVREHGFGFHYEYTDGLNCFIIAWDDTGENKPGPSNGAC